jgi:hypothetical protein
MIVLIQSSVSGTTNEPVRLIVPDGQLRSHPIRVFLDADITTAMKPTLTLIASHALLNRGHREMTTNLCSFLARDQPFSQEIRGVPVSGTGTLLLFDLDERFHIPWYKAVMRVTPSLAWYQLSVDGKEQEVRMAGGDQEIYVGNIIGAFIWTTGVMAAISGFIWFSCVKCKGSVLPLLCAPDGTLSLWRGSITGLDLRRRERGGLFRFHAIKYSSDTGDISRLDGHVARDGRVGVSGQQGTTPQCCKPTEQAPQRPAGRITMRRSRSIISCTSSNGVLDLVDAVIVPRKECPSERRLGGSVDHGCLNGR